MSVVTLFLLSKSTSVGPTSPDPISMTPVLAGYVSTIASEQQVAVISVYFSLLFVNDSPKLLKDQCCLCVNEGEVKRPDDQNKLGAKDK